MEDMPSYEKLITHEILRCLSFQAVDIFMVCLHSTRELYTLKARHKRTLTSLN